MSLDPPSRNRFALAVVRLAGTWILAGAVAKLFLGTPKDLPEMVRHLSPFGVDLTFHLVIGVELCLVALAWIVPQLAWPLLLLLFGFFDFILVSQMLAGATSCGCFGATIHVSPKLMLAVDSALFVSILASRPWSATRNLAQRAGTIAAALAICFAASFAMPWIVIRMPSEAGPGTEAPRWADMNPEKWLNRPIYEIEELTRWIDPEKLPTDGKVVLWRQGCTHCAAHLRLMAGHDDGSQPILLVQIRDDLKDGRAVDLMPDGANVTHVEMPENQQFMLQTPWELRVSGGIVVAALDEEHAKELYEKGG